MIPNNSSNTNGCNPISSNCVVWQGPDIPCLELCNGATVSDVVALLAEQICASLGVPMRSDDPNAPITVVSTPGGETTINNTTVAVDISSIVQKCISQDNGRNAESIQELLQWMIDRICADDQVQAEIAAQDPCAFATSCTLPLPKCMEYTVGGFSTRAATGPGTGLAGPSSNLATAATATDNVQGGTLITEEVLYDESTNSGWIVTVGNYVCGLYNSIQSFQNTLDNHEQRITHIENNCCGGTQINTTTATATTIDGRPPVSTIGSGNPTTNTNTPGTLKSGQRRSGANEVAEQVISKYLRNGVVTAGTLAVAVEKEYYELRRATGSATELRKSITYQQTGLAAEDRLNGKGTMGIAPGFKASPATIADTIQNLWITTNDMRNALVNMQSMVMPTNCSELIFDVQANIVYTTANIFSYLHLDFTGCEIPPGWTDCHKSDKTKMTIQDSSFNFVTKYYDVSGNYQNNSAGVQLNASELPNIDITSNLVVKVQFNVCNEGNNCGETISTTAIATQPCPTLSGSTVTESSITFAYGAVEFPSGGFVTVSLLNALGSTLQSVNFQSWSNGLNGSFTGLTAGTTYALQVSYTNKGTGVSETCPWDKLMTKAPSCLNQHAITATSLETDFQSGANTLELGAYYVDASTPIKRWVAGFNSSNFPIFGELTTETVPAIAWTHYGEFVSDNPTEAIYCGTKSFTATGMTTAMENSGWKYVGNLTDPIGNIFRVFALVNSDLHLIREVVFCCTCNQLTLTNDTHFGVNYCASGAQVDCKVDIIGDVSSTVVTPSFNILVQPNHGTVSYSETNSTETQGCFTYQHNGDSGFVSDSFLVQYKNACGKSNQLSVPIVRAMPVKLTDAPIVVFVDANSFVGSEALKIKASMLQMYSALQTTCNYNGSIYFIGVTGSNSGDYIKHLKSCVEGVAMGATPSISIASGGDWDTFLDKPDYWKGSHSHLPAAVTIFSFINQTNSNANYGGANLAAGWAGQPTSNAYAGVPPYYKEDYSAVIDIFDGKSSSKWAVDEQAKSGATWKAGSIPFKFSHILVNMATGTINESAASMLQTLGALKGATMSKEEIIGAHTGGVQFPIALQSYIQTGMGSNPYTGNDTGTPANAIVGLAKLQYACHLYFQNGIDWSLTNGGVKRAFLAMLGITAGSNYLCVTQGTHPRVGSTNFAFKAHDAADTNTVNAAETCTLAQTPANLQYPIYCSTGGMFDANVKAYSTPSGSTNAQAEYELAAGWYAVGPGCNTAPSTAVKVAKYNPTGGVGNYWQFTTNCQAC